MNETTLPDLEAVKKLLDELTDYKRPVSYNLREILIIPLRRGYWVTWRKDGSS